MTTSDQHPTTRSDSSDTHHGMGHAGHGWMMIVCCIPMLIIAFVLVATGVASVGFIFAALLCTAMMAAMMWGMNHAGSGH